MHSLAQPLTSSSGYQRAEQQPVRDRPSETFCARPGPAWTPLGQARNRQGCAPCRVRRHAALTVRDIQDAWMVAALFGAHGQAFRTDRNRRDGLCRGRNADAVTSAYWA